MFNSNLKEAIKLSDETIRWRARDVTYFVGTWKALSSQIPCFVIDDFKASESGPANPHFCTVIREPITAVEQRIPVGIVSKSYRLVQHFEVVDMCLKGLNAHGIPIDKLQCDLGLTTLGEWMNFRIYFPESYSFGANDNNKLSLRLECFNSVDGSSRLIVQLSWFRLICSNGMTVKETTAVLSDVHNQNLKLEVIPEIIAKGLNKVSEDKDRLQQWEKFTVDFSKFDEWIDSFLTSKWGKKAACRALNICLSGRDAELLDLFVGGRPSKKPKKLLNEVPGARNPATNLYDVSQALSYIATQRKNAEERMEWQGDIPEIIDDLRSYLKAS